MDCAHNECSQQLVVATGVLLGPEEAIEVEQGGFSTGRIGFDLRPMQFHRFRNKETDLQQISVNISVSFSTGIQVSCGGMHYSEPDEDGDDDDEY